MNLNSIHSYKKLNKIKKDTIIEPEKESPSAQKPTISHANTLQTRNQKYRQLDAHMTNASTKTVSNQTVTLFPLKSNKLPSSSANVPNTRNLETVQKLIKAEQDNELMGILRDKFSQELPEQISGLVLNNKFKAQNLNMNINIHYNSTDPKNHDKMKVFDQGLLMKKSLKYSEKNNSLYGESDINDSKPPHGYFGVNSGPYSSSFYKNSKTKHSFHETHKPQTILPTYEQVYSKRPNNQKPKRAKTQKAKQFKSLTSNEPHNTFYSSVNPFQQKHYYKTLNRYEIDEGQETLKNQNRQEQMRHRYQSLEVREGAHKRKNFILESQEKNDGGDKCFIQNNRIRLSTQILLPDDQIKKNPKKSRRILTQQGSKDERRILYESIDLYQPLNNLKKSKQKTQNKLSSRNNSLAKNRISQSKDQKSSSMKEEQIIKGMSKTNVLREEKAINRVLKSDQKGKKSLSQAQFHKDLISNHNKRYEFTEKRYGPIRSYEKQNMPYGLKSHKYQLMGDESQAKKSGYRRSRQEQKLWMKEYTEEELREQIRELINLIVQKRLLTDQCIGLRLTIDRQSYCSKLEPIQNLQTQKHKLPLKQQPDKHLSKLQSTLTYLQQQLESKNTQTYKRLSFNRLLATDLILGKVAHSLVEISMSQQLKPELKSALVHLHKGLVSALEQLETVRVKQQAGYHVYQRREEDFLGVSRILLFKVLKLLIELGKNTTSQFSSQSLNQFHIPQATPPILQVEYLLMLQLLQILNRDSCDRQLSKKIVQMSVNLFSLLRKDSDDKAMVDLRFVAEVGIFYTVKQLGLVNEKFARLNQSIKDVKGFVEIDRYAESEKSDVKVKLSKESKQFQEMFGYLKGDSLDAISQCVCSICDRVLSSFTRTKPHKQPYFIGQISLCEDIDSLVNELARLLDPKNHWQLNIVMISLKMTELRSRRKLLQVLLCQSDNRVRLAEWVSEYLQNIDGVNWLIEQSQLNITNYHNLEAPISSALKPMTNHSPNKQQQQSLHFQNLSHIRKPQFPQSNMFILSHISELISNESDLRQIKTFYLEISQSQINGEISLLKAYKMYLEGNFYQCQISIEQAIPKARQPYLNKLLSLSVTLKIAQNNFYEAYHFLQGLPYHGVFLDHVKLSAHITKQDKHSDFTFEQSLQNQQKSAETQSQMFIKQNGTGRKGMTQQSLVELKCLELFCTGVVLLMKKKLQEGLELLNQAREILDGPTLKRHNTNNNSNIKTYDRSLLPTFLPQIQSVIQAYLAYAHYCLNGIDKAEECLLLQKEIIAESDGELQPSQNTFETTIAYNYLLILGLKQLKRKNYQKGIEHLKECLKVMNKPEPHAYLAILYFRIWAQDSNNSSVQTKSLEFDLEDMYVHLSFACNLVQEMNNNFASSIFYLRSLYYTWNGKLQLALIDADEAIEKAEENYSKHFYLRGLVLALNENYRQAINELSLALSINQKDTNSYLLRSRCCQIQGDQNQAFMDLQTYITLCPNDMQIHKYAGHLLFENGAFQDALSAYQQGDLPSQQNSPTKPNESDFHVFLTKSKTFFLLGQFTSATESMKVASDIKPNETGYHFDYQMMKWLGQVIAVFDDDYRDEEMEEESHVGVGKKKGKTMFAQKILQKLVQLDRIYQFPMGKQSTDLKSDNQQTNPIPQTYLQTHGKIFKQVEYNMFRFALLFYLQHYKEARTELQKCISVKEAIFKQQKQNKLNHECSEFEEEDNEKELFISQMRYNLAVVNLKLRRFGEAQKELEMCQLEKASKGFSEWRRLMTLISNEGKNSTINQFQQKQPHIKVFSDKNKLSKFFPQLQVNFQSHNYTLIKLIKPCLPYPKVQPPEISPKFDLRLLESFTEDDIEKKPQAPWIKNQKNSIKFTEQIKTFSRLDIDCSQAESRKVKRPLGRANLLEEESGEECELDEEFEEQKLVKRRSSKINSKISNNQRHKGSCSKYSSSISSSLEQKELRKLLKLDDEVEMKLKRLMKKTDR